METFAKDVSTKRKKVGKQLVKQIQQEFEELKMGTMQIQVNLVQNTEKEIFGPSGIDRLELLLAPNPGEPPMPLGRIASGGELSRIMLALKTVFAGNDHTPVVIFDEIDSGVGGEAGMVMGKRLRELAQFHQVCCITHLPQIAAFADVHFRVEKSDSNGRVCATVSLLDESARIEEIARMAGGEKVTAATRQHAKDLLSGKTPK